MKLVLYTQAYISTSILFDLTKMIQKIKNSSGDHNLLFDLWLVRICAALWAWACRGRCHLSDIFPFLKVSLSNSKYLIFYICCPWKWKMEQASVTAIIHIHVYMYCHHQFFYHFWEIVTIPNYLHNGTCIKKTQHTCRLATIFCTLFGL